jgi:hypothetical protein
MSIPVATTSAPTIRDPGSVAGGYVLYDAFLLVDVVAGIFRGHLGVGSTLISGNNVDRVRRRASVPEEYGFHRAQAFCDALSYLVGVHPILFAAAQRLGGTSFRATNRGHRQV